MNKNKKIAMAVVATVMAGTMVIPFAACDKPDVGGNKVDLEKWNVLKEDGSLDYSVYEGNEGVTLNIAIGHDGATTSTSFDVGTNYKLVDGNTYEGGAMKPAWKQMGQDLHIEWKDVFVKSKAGQTSSNLKTIVSGGTYAGTDIFTTDLSQAVSYATAGTDILNLGDYLDYMPNFKNYLETHPIVYLSLLQDGMSTTDGSGKTLYIAPYFDGNDDIERYCIIRQDWAEKLLGDATITDGEKFSEKCASTTKVEPFMTDLTSLKVDVTKPEQDEKGEYTKDGVVYKNYANVQKQITTGGTDLYAAYHAITNADYPQSGSGNIVAIMNAAIALNADVTGDKLVALFRAYIDACYTKTNTVGADKYYTNRADLFNGYDAAWDVDDLVAMLRCVMTNQANLISTDSGATTVFGIAPRSGQNDRTPDMVRLACQLYGARGADSRNEYTYIDSEGKLQDARNDEAFYQACENMNKLRQENLVADYSATKNFLNETGYNIDNKEKNNQPAETFMMYDYCQTQTAAGFYNEDAMGVDVPSDYNFAPILTPVSKWDVNGNGKADNDEYFRFTESWRSTKTSGLALNGGLATDKAKLTAALQFVDYLYSADGQIVSTYGPMAENAQGKNGFWYNAKATQAEKDAGKYFTYKGVEYSGVLYKGRYTPKITDEVMNSFQGLYELDKNTKLPDNVGKAILSFTNYARMLIGSTLPLGVKDQSFENQLTTTKAKTGAEKVGASLANEIGDTGYTVIRGLSLDIVDDKMWYTCVPTSLPVPALYKTQLDDPTMNPLKNMSGEAQTSGDKNFYSIFNHIILNGLGTGYDDNGQKYTFTTLDKLVTDMSTEKRAQDRENYMARGWENAKSYWTYLKTEGKN